MTLVAELETVKNEWPKVKDILSVPHSEKQYKRLVKILDVLIDEIGENERHPLAPLLETIGNLIESYETDNLTEFKSDPIDTLKYLIQEHNLTQKDLKELGSQGVVSEILNGKRQLNVRQIHALSKKFKVSPAVFI